MSFEFTKKNQEIALNIIAKYPETRRFSAIMPLLTLAQKQNSGSLNSEIIDYLAQYLKVSQMALYEVANFYSMYRFNPIGKYHFQFCRSIVCLVTDYKTLVDTYKEVAQLQKQDVSDDGLFSIEMVECLGACCNAPAIKVNDMFFENVTINTLKELVENLKQGKDLGINNKVQQSIAIS